MRAVANDTTHVWYACYGSNLRRDRFLAYIEGGPVPDGEGAQVGSVDPSPPRIDWPYLTGWDLQFAFHSARWGGGVAYLAQSNRATLPRDARDAVKRGTMCRLYLLSHDQFVDVLIQENDGDPKADPGLRETVSRFVTESRDTPADGRLLPDGVLATGWYRRLVSLGHRDEKPILTFTTERDVDFSAPSASYLKTIALGLLEAYPQLTTDELTDYLARCARSSPEALDAIVTDAVRTYLESSARRCAHLSESADRGGIGYGEHDGHQGRVGCFRVLATKLRHDTRREYIIQLPAGRMEALGLSKRELVAVAAWHHGVEYRVLATVLPSPGEVDDATRTIGEASSARRALADHEIALDQKLRVAIGARIGDWVALHKLTERRRGSALRWFIEGLIRTQPQMMRVHLATFDDMEIDLARLPRSTFDVIGSQPGSVIAVSSTRGRTHVRAAELTEDAMQVRRDQMKKESARYADARTLLELDRLRGGSQADLPPIFIDYDTRHELKIGPGQPVRAVRDALDVLLSRVYVLAFPVLLGLILAVLSFEHKGWTTTLVRLGAFGVMIFLTFVVVLWELRSRFKPR